MEEMTVKPNQGEGMPESECVEIENELAEYLWSSTAAHLKLVQLKVRLTTVL